MKLQKYADHHGNMYYVNPMNGDVFQPDGLGSIFSKIGNIFAQKASGSGAGNFLRNAFGKKEGGSDFGNFRRSLFKKKEGGTAIGNGIRDLTRKFAGSAGGVLPGPLPNTLPSSGIFTPGFQNDNRPAVKVEQAPPPEPKKDNTLFYVVGGIGALAVAGGIAYAVSQKKEKEGE